MSRTLSILAIAAIALVGCGGSEENGGDDLITVEAWWENPGAIKDRLAAVGSAKVVGNKSAARTRAQADARAQLAATMKAEITQLVESWSKEAGDLMNEGSLSSYFNDEIITRQYVDTVLQGSRPMRTKEVDGYVYCLMVLDDPVKWQNNVNDSLSDQLLRDETLWKTEAMKSQFRDRLDEIKQENEEKRTQGQRKFEEVIEKSGS